jgi:uncharacterized membrane protein YoaK (UPF0700 family)
MGACALMAVAFSFLVEGNVLWAFFSLLVYAIVRPPLLFLPHGHPHLISSLLSRPVVCLRVDAPVLLVLRRHLRSHGYASATMIPQLMAACTRRLTPLVRVDVQIVSRYLVMALLVILGALKVFVGCRAPSLLRVPVCLPLTHADTTHNAHRAWKWWVKRNGHSQADYLRNLNTLDDDLEVYKTDM